MRLIDADKLENDIAENITVKAVSRMLAITQGQPTVKAIPIKWLKKYAKKKENLYIPYSTVIMRILEDWEKENETN